VTINAIIYVRSSIDCSASAEEQAECLQAVATSHRWTVAKMFSDHPMPMKRGREQRPGETALLAAIRSGGVNKVLMFSIDRLGRSLPELVGLLEACREAGVEVYIHDRRIDTATRNGLSLFDFGQMMALHLRQGRRDKILRGQAAARIANVRFGRPPIARGTMERAKAFLGTGRGVRETARLSGISAASVSKLKNVADTAST
jgi:DNA invertase Pin-like site-specific DNA recombinase